jgi:hypothetical protein
MIIISYLFQFITIPNQMRSYFAEAFFQNSILKSIDYCMLFLTFLMPNNVINATIPSTSVYGGRYEKRTKI